MLNAAREKHYQAHVHWEWWTSTNGGSFHNPDQAKESINRSMVLSQEGIKLLDDAIKMRRSVALKAPAGG